MKNAPQIPAPARRGQAAALALKHKLVRGDLRASRTQAGRRGWLKPLPHGYLCCARGGQRSHIVQQWLKKNTWLIGGYKALRQRRSSHRRTGAAPDRADWRLYRQRQTQLVCSRPDGIDTREGLCSSPRFFIRSNPAQISIRRYAETTLAVSLLKKPKC